MSKTAIFMLIWSFTSVLIIAGAIFYFVFHEPPRRNNSNLEKQTTPIQEEVTIAPNEDIVNIEPAVTLDQKVKQETYTTQEETPQIKSKSPSQVEAEIRSEDTNKLEPTPLPKFTNSPIPPKPAKLDTPDFNEKLNYKGPCKQYKTTSGMINTKTCIRY